MTKKHLMIFTAICLILLCISFSACSIRDTVYLYETGSFGSGVTFTVNSIEHMQKISYSIFDWTTTDSFLYITITVYNGSKTTFTASTLSPDIWLNYNGTIIKPHTATSWLPNGFESVNQPATVTKTYVVVFELAESIPDEDLILVINKPTSDFLISERVGIYLRER